MFEWFSVSIIFTFSQENGPQFLLHLLCSLGLLATICNQDSRSDTAEKTGWNQSTSRPCWALEPDSNQSYDRFSSRELITDSTPTLSHREESAFMNE